MPYMKSLLWPWLRMSSQPARPSTCTPVKGAAPSCATAGAATAATASGAASRAARVKRRIQILLAQTPRLVDAGDVGRRLWASPPEPWINRKRVVVRVQQTEKDAAPRG